MTVQLFPRAWQRLRNLLESSDPLEKLQGERLRGAVEVLAAGPPEDAELLQEGNASGRSEIRSWRVGWHRIVFEVSGATITILDIRTGL